MKNLFGIFILIIVGMPSGQVYSQNKNEMDNYKMNTIIHKESLKVEGKMGNWQAVYGNRLLYIITDANANRMRIMTPIVEMKEVKKKELKILLEANFDRALDAKYSIFEEYLMSVYTHPLKELTREQFIDAMQQVVVLANTYGSTYTSTNMIFGGGEEKKD